MVFLSIDKGKLCIKISRLGGKRDIVRRFALTDVDGPAKVLAPFVHAEVPIMSSSTMDFPREAGAPKGYSRTRHMAAIRKKIGPSDETLMRWATIAAAALHIGRTVPKPALKMLVSRGYLTSGKTPQMTAKMHDTIGYFVTEYLAKGAP